MSFREFITNLIYRKKVIKEAQRQQNVKPPDAPSREEMDDLVRRLSDPFRAGHAHKKLAGLGAQAAAALAAGLCDPSLAELEIEAKHEKGPLQRIMELLLPHDPEAILIAAMPLLSSSSDKIRKIAAIHLASLGRPETVPVLNQLLQDADGYIRSYVAMGVGRAVSNGSAGDEFRQQMYESLLNQCDQDWHGATNGAAEAVLKLDPVRAAIDFASARWLSSENRYVSKILKVCNEKRVRLPEYLLRGLIEHSLPLAVGERCYPHEYVAAAALEALARSIGSNAKPILKNALTSDQKEIQEAAAKGLALLTGLDDPLNFVLGQLNQVGLGGLTPPQRVFFHAYVFDAEVCNGGIMQFFGNSGGGHAAETLEALKTLGHAEGREALETAMNLIGTPSQEGDRDRRLSGFTDRFDELQKQFDPLESAYYRTNGRLKQSMLLYAVEHADHFRSGPSGGT